MSAQPIDYDALAAQHGGTAASAAVDYDALAAEHGGTAIESQPAIADEAHAEIKAHPGGVRQWLTDLEGDLRYGGTQTAVGRALKSAGYKGAESLGGMEGTAGKTLVSPLTGPVFAAHGVAEMASGNVKRGTGEVLSGIGEAAQIPTAFAAPETAEAGSEALGKITPSLPATRLKAAGELFQKVQAKAGDFPVNVETPGSVALRIKDLADRGGSLPMVVRKFLNRVTNPDGGPVTYSEARDFYSNASRLSADETQRLTPKLKFEVGRFTRALGSSIQDAANDAGVGTDHSRAMADYANAMTWQDRMDAAKDAIVKAAVKGSGAAATAYGAKKIWDASK